MGAAGTIARLRPLLLDLEDAAALEPPGVTESAVLVPLTVVDDEVRVVFTRRRDDLRRHAGEFSFPGGRRDPGEANLIETALRETEEEVGIDRSLIELIGALQPTATIATDFSIHPFVGVVPAGAARVAEPAEVAEVIEVPLGELVASRERRRLTRRDLAFHTTVYPVGDRVIWGATARILDDLVDRLGVEG
ncbi:MAG: CoA pyrophosphatase [Actinomycetes bacterium]